MELYKFINENEIKRYSGGFVVIDNRIYTNPTEETIKKAGYKPLAEKEVPEYHESTQYVSITYTQTDDIIEPVYEVKSYEHSTESDQM